MKIHVTPMCCADVQQERAVAIEVSNPETLPWTPSWYLTLTPSYNRHLDWGEIHRPPVAPKFCPYCGTSLPAIEPRPGIIAPIWRGDTDYCGTCNERNMNCCCLPPWATFQPASGDDLDVNKLWQRAKQIKDVLE